MSVTICGVDPLSQEKEPRFEGSRSINSSLYPDPVMFRNYLTVALRNLRKQKGYAFINITGLALGLATCLLIVLYIQDELSYDRFHEKADRIYELGLRGVVGGQFLEIADTSTPMGPAMKADLPEVENFTRVKSMGRVLFSHDDVRFFEEKAYWVDSTFFSVFTFPFVRGNPATALTAPKSMILTASTAKRYFGDADPIGQMLRFDNREEYAITGIIQDGPANSHLRFDMLISMETVLPYVPSNWLSHHLHTFVLLRQNVPPESIENKFSELIETYVAPEFEKFAGTTLAEARAAGMEFGYYMQPLTKLYLEHVGSDPVGPTSDIRYVYVLGVVALFILLLACINFMNLSTARSARRAREVGLRKALGSERRQLIQQFLGESVLLAFLALLLAAALALGMLPLFGALAGKSFSLAGGKILTSLAFLVGIALASGLLAGIYPALVLSAFRPVAVLKGRLSGGARGSWLRSSLVVAQFVISIILLIGTGVVFEQLQFMQNERLGFSGEQVVMVPIQSQSLRDRYETFRQTLLQDPGIVTVAASDFVPGRLNNTTAFRPEGAPSTENYVLATGRVSFDYLETLGIELLTGRDFNRDFATDASDASLINETAVRELGWTPEEAVGKRLIEISGGPNDEPVTRTIIGVMKDFNFESLHERIRPLSLNIAPGQFQRVSIRVQPDNMRETLAYIQARWQEFEPGFPYNAVFLNADFNRFYTQEERLGKIFVVFTFLAIGIACLGLFGLASFVAQQRTKEIGVRKVMGATVPGIILMLTKEFTKLVLLASALAIPVAFLLMRQWLQNFAYQTGIAWWIFATAAGAALTIAWLTVGYQSVRAAVANPIDALRYE